MTITSNNRPLFTYFNGNAPEHAIWTLNNLLRNVGVLRTRGHSIINLKIHDIPAQHINLHLKLYRVRSASNVLSVAERVAYHKIKRLSFNCQLNIQFSAPHEVVGRYGDAQLWMSDNYAFNLRQAQLMIYPINRQIIQLEFSPTWSCVSLTRSTTSSEWKLCRFDKMEVNCFQILLIDVTFYLYHVQKVVLDVLVKNENLNICGTGG